MMAKIAALRDKYYLQMKVERFVSDDVPSGDENISANKNYGEL